MIKQEPIPFNGIAREYKELKHWVTHAQDEVLSSGQLVGGPATHKFEEAMAERCGVRNAIAINSGTAGLDMVLRLYAKRDDCVKMPSLSYIATKNVVEANDLESNYFDVDKFTGLIDIDLMIANTNACRGRGATDPIMYANLFGNVIDYPKLREAYPDAFIIEDAAQSFGSWFQDKPSGSLGDVSVLSFDPTKNLANYGSGGMLLTNNTTIFCELASFVSNHTLDLGMGGTNAVMNEVDCAIMNIKLYYFDAWQAHRTEIAEYYNQNLHENIGRYKINPFVYPNWSKYLINLECYDRNAVMLALFDEGIETKLQYREPLCYYPNAEHWCNNWLALPIHPYLTPTEVERIVETVNRVVPKCSYSCSKS